MSKGKSVIKVYLLPPKWSEQQYQALHNDIMRAAKGVSDWGIKSENDLITLFPPDLMKKGIGTEIHVEVDLAHHHSEPHLHPGFSLLQDQIASAMVIAIHNTIELAGAYVQCKVYPFFDRRGFSSVN